LANLVATHRDTAPKLAEWLEKNLPEGLVVRGGPGFWTMLAAK
jgi:hypothetical protein